MDPGSNTDRAADAGLREDMLATAAVVAVYFAFMLLVGFAPDYLKRPLVSGGTISIGLALGIFATVFIVGVAKVYTVRRNK